MKKISINIIFNALRTIITLLFPLITFPYAARILGVSNIGLVQFYISLISYFTLFAALGIPFYAIKEGAKYRDNKQLISKFISEMISILLITTTIAYLVLYFLYSIKEQSFDGKLLLIISMNIFFSTFSLDWLFQLQEKFVYISLRTFFIRLISLICLFLFVKTESDYYIYAMINVGIIIVGFITNWIALRKNLTSIKIKFSDLRRHIKPIFIIFCSTIATTIYMNMDVVMLGIMIGTISVGLYTVSVKVNQAVKMVISSVSSVMVSRLSYYAGLNQREKYESSLSHTFNFVSFILLPCAFGLIVLSDQVIILFSGYEYLEASFASKILSVSIIFSVIDTLLYYQILLPLNREKEAALATIVGAIVNLILNFIIIPIYSFNGAAVTTLVAEIAVFLVLVYYAKREVTIFKYLSQTLLFAICSLPVLFIGIITKEIFINPIYIVLMTVFLSVLYYIPLIFFIKKEYFLLFKRLVIKKIIKN